jgi:putative ABC transport system permease protein
VFNLTVKSLWGHKRRLVGTFLAVFIGIGFLSGTLALGDTLRSNFKNLFNTVDKGVDAVVRSSTAISPGGIGGGGFKQRGLINASLVTQVRAVPGVLRAQPQVQGIAQILDKHGKPIGGNGPPTLASNWYDDPDLNPYHLIAGHAPAAPNEVVIDNDAASKGPFRIGDTTIVETPEPVTVHIVGIVRFGSQGSALGATFTGFTLADAQRYLLGSPGQLSSISIKAVPGVSQAALVGRLQRVLPRGVQAITGSTQISENIDSINSGFLNLLRTFLLIFAGIALLVGTFSIYNTFSILVAQRTRESALLRAVGASRGQVFAAIVGESIAVGIVASVAGMFGGVGVALGLKGVFSAFAGSLPAGGLVFKSSTVIISLIVGLVVTVLAGVMPAVRASRTRPIAALREVATEGATASRPRAVAGAILVSLGVVIVLTAVISGGGGVLARAGLGSVLVLVGMVVFGPVVARTASGTIGRPFARLRGITAVLARQNAMRNPRRTSGTAAALMVGVGVVTLFTVFAASLKASANHAISTTFAGDLVVRAKGFGDTGLSPALAGRLETLPPVARTVGIGSGVALVAGTGHQLTVVDPAKLPGVFDLKVTRGSLTSLGDRDMAIDTKAADNKHWTIGTMVPIGFTDGTSAAFRVGAIYKPAGPQSGYIITRTAWAPHAQQQSDVVVLVKLKPGADLTQAKAAITRFVVPYGAPTVQDRKEYVRSVGNMVNRLLALVYVMLLLAIVIALMGIGNTLSLSIYERTRELGLLRAVGETRGQVRGMVRWEAVIVALFGTVGGVLLGVFLGWSLVKAAQSSQGISRFSASPPQLILVLILGALAGVLAGWRPARRAARLDILRAIATE